MILNHERYCSYTIANKLFHNYFRTLVALFDQISDHTLHSREVIRRLIKICHWTGAFPSATRVRLVKTIPFSLSLWIRKLLPCSVRDILSYRSNNNFLIIGYDKLLAFDIFMNNCILQLCKIGAEVLNIPGQCPDQRYKKPDSVSLIN